jgi:hypothetical protein
VIQERQKVLQKTTFMFLMYELLQMKLSEGLMISGDLLRDSEEEKLIPSAQQWRKWHLQMKTRNRTGAVRNEMHHFGILHLKKIMVCN